MPAWVYVYPVHAVLSEARRDVRSPHTGVTGGCELPVWVLGTEPGSSTGAVSTLSCQAVSPGPHFIFHGGVFGFLKG